MDGDLQLLDLQLSDLQIASISSVDLKKIVKSKAKEAAFRHLIEIKERKSKMDNITYLSSFLPQSYMLNMTREQSSLMLALRTRTLRGIRTDFGDMFLDKHCPLPGCLAIDSIPHLLVCPALLAAVPAEDTAVQYGDVFASCLSTQTKAISRFSELVKTRTRLLDLNL